MGRTLRRKHLPEADTIVRAARKRAQLRRVNRQNTRAEPEVYSRTARGLIDFALYARESRQRAYEALQAEEMTTRETI